MAGEPMSLLVVENVVTDGVVRERHLVRLTFDRGHFSRRELLLRRSRNFFAAGADRLHEGRLVVNWSGNVIETRTGKVLLEYDGVVIDIWDGRVYLSRFYSPENIRYHYHDLDTLQTVELSDPGVWEPGVRSPDRTMSVVYSQDKKIAWDSDELWLSVPGMPTTRLFKGMSFQIPPDTYSFGMTVVLWVDNSRLLTQTANGRLRLVVIDGTSQALLDIEELQGPDAPLPSSPPCLYHDREGKVVYHCGQHRWIIDVERRTYRRWEWEPFGHGFYGEAPDGTERDRIVTYRGREIGRHFTWGFDPRTAEGRLALLLGENVGQERKRLVVWLGGDWHAITGTFESLVGWVAPRPEN